MSLMRVDCVVCTLVCDDEKQVMLSQAKHIYTWRTSRSIAPCLGNLPFTCIDYLLFIACVQHHHDLAAANMNVAALDPYLTACTVPYVARTVSTHYASPGMNTLIGSCGTFGPTTLHVLGK